MKQQSLRQVILHALFSVLTGKAPEQAAQHVQPSCRPAMRDHDAWHAYWEALGQPWRTEPEIDLKRQVELKQRRAIVPDIEKGIYPFKGMKLSRADVEWLLATLKDGHVPVDWDDESQAEREGLDVRGADLREIDLQNLPLIRIIGGLDNHELPKEALSSLSNRHFEEAAVRLDGANLDGAKLSGANLVGAYMKKTCLANANLRGANLAKAHLEEADLMSADLEDAWFDEAHLKGASLFAATLDNTIFSKADLKDTRLGMVDKEPDGGLAFMFGTYFGNAHLENAELRDAHLEDISFSGAHLEGADLRRAHLENSYFREANLVGANLEGVHLEGADLHCAHLELTDLRGVFFNAQTNLENAVLSDEKRVGPRLADVHWGDINLTVVKWSEVHILGDEYVAKTKTSDEGKMKDNAKRMEEHETAARANRQLAIVLREQGLSEDAVRFAYRAHILKKRFLYFQMLQRKIKLRQRLLVLGKWLFSWFLFILAGYGYRPERSFLTYFLVNIGFALVYYLLGPSLSPISALALSVTTFHGRGFFPGVTQLSDSLMMLTSIEAFLGLLIEVTFIATLTQWLFER